MNGAGFMGDRSCMPGMAHTSVGRGVQELSECLERVVRQSSQGN